MYGKQNRNKNAQSTSNFPMQDLLKGKSLELVTAALLLTGKLQVESVEFFRGSPVIGVTLLGKYLNEQNKANALAEFLEDNDMTLDDVFDAFQERIQKESK